MGKSITTPQHREARLSALCALSGHPIALDPTATTTLIKESPDPETALRAVLAQVPATSEALQRKWRKAVIDLWAPHHRHIPLLLDLPLATSDVSDAPILHDANAFLREIQREPAEMNQENGEWLLAPEDIYRISSCLPSRAGREIFPLEHEWADPTLRRLRATLQLLRLVRRVKSKLSIVRSRYERFIGLPEIQQFYLLWHAETYHLDWSSYAGMWSPYIRVIQEYVPLLWEMNEEIPATVPQSIHRWCMRLGEVYTPLWEQEGLLQESAGGKEKVLSLIQRQYLPAACATMLLSDLLVRYGLVLIEGEFFAITDVGENLLAAERSQEIPCGLELLS